VRLQLALSLPEANTKPADAALVSLVAEAGRQPFLADAAVSGIAGREVEFIEALAREPGAALRAVDAVRFATSAVLRGGDAGAIDRVLRVAASDGMPAWSRSAVLSG
jgi:hypothetical protein